VLEKQTSATPILTEEMAACNKGVRYIELPIAFDALTVAVHPQNDWAKDIGELKRSGNQLPKEKSPVGSKFVRLGLIDRLTCMVQVIKFDLHFRSNSR